MEYETIWLAEQEGVPNNPRLPVLIYREAFEARRAEAAEALFAGHGWPPAWRDGIYGHVHIHTTAHEALAIIEGEVLLQLGGEGTVPQRLQAGDVVVLPAGTGHKCLLASEDLLVLGAYPEGQRPDEQCAEPGQAAAARARIARLPDPPACPVTGQPYRRRP
ncbi:cupin domain-containing protein [Pseudoroseomonas sp. WGS1072]|uniref:cupin domain-containing protein n=1 Tax=Roseomonas sp. WGS1072 TaxID=3366816 RepID=UPI003BF2280A